MAKIEEKEKLQLTETKKHFEFWCFILENNWQGTEIKTMEEVISLSAEFEWPGCKIRFDRESRAITITASDGAEVVLTPPEKSEGTK